MKKYLLLLLSVLFVNIIKAQVVSIVPNSGNQGQTLVTTITTANGVISMASPPMQMNDIYLQQGATIIYATNYSLYPNIPNGFADSLSATFDIPALAADGLYDVHVTTYYCAGCPGGPTPIDNILSAGFYIGNVAGHAEGDVYYDQNQNGVRDVGEGGLANKWINVNPLGMTVLTDNNGHYSIPSDTASLNISVTANPPFTLTSLPTVYTVQVPPDTTGLDFGLYAPPSVVYTQEFYMQHNRLRCSILGNTFWSVRNSGTLQHTGSVTMTYSSNLTYDSASITPTSVSGNTIRWDYTLPPYGLLVSNVYFMAPPAGDTIWYTATDSVFDMLGNFQNVYVDSFRTVVRCSYDPNDKTVSTPGEGGAHYTLKSSDLDYLIRFQNTGNDTAYIVQVTDTIDPNLDLATMEILNSSHTYHVQVDANRVAKFTFNNIMLPDSNVDEPGSHGFIAYRINAVSNIPDNTVIENTAYIYFDFNAPVVTNTEFNTMVTQLPVAVNEIPREAGSLVFPNPLTDASMLTITSSEVFDLRIFDETGREVMRRTISGNYLLPKNKFSAGVYYYQLRAKESIRSVGKFVVIE